MASDHKKGQNIILLALISKLPSTRDLLDQLIAYAK
jgi:hypothetical protein